MTTKPGTTQIVEREESLPQIVNSADKNLRELLLALDEELQPPLAMRESSPADLVVTINSLNRQNSETLRNRTTPPIGGELPDFTSGTITFPSSNTGGDISPSVGADVALSMGADSFLKVGVNLNDLGEIVLELGTEGATAALATVPDAVPNTFAIGYVLIETVSGTVQNIDSSALFQYVGGGSGSGGGLTTESKSAAFLAERGIHYLVDTSSNGLFSAIKDSSLAADTTINATPTLRPGLEISNATGLLTDVSVNLQSFTATVGTIEIRVYNGTTIASDLVASSKNSYNVADLSAGAQTLDFQMEPYYADNETIYVVIHTTGLDANLIFDAQASQPAARDTGAASLSTLSGNVPVGVFSGDGVLLPPREEGAVIRFTDAAQTFGTNPLRIYPAQGERIAEAAIDEVFELDVKLAWAQVQEDTTLGYWTLDSVLPSQAVGLQSLNGLSTSAFPVQTFSSTDGSITVSSSGGDHDIELADTIAGARTFSDDLTVGSTALFVDVSTNRVGIGTGSPDEKFHLFEPTGGVKLRVESVVSNNTPGVYGNEIQLINTQNTNQRITGAITAYGNNTTTPHSSIEFQINSQGGANGKILFSGRNNSDTYVVKGECGVDGEWTWGPSGLDQEHQVNGSLFVTLPSATAGTKLFDVTGSAGGSVSFRLFEDSWSVGGSMLPTGTGNTVFWNAGAMVRQSSASRYKENIQALTNGLSTVEALSPKTYTRKNTQQLEHGLIAEEVLELLPELVTYEEDGQVSGLVYDQFIPFLISAIQELNTKVESLEAQLSGGA